MLDLDFLEIGTCDYDSVVQTTFKNAIGIVVEPIKEYLDNLPDLPNVKKVNLAISPDGSEGNVDMYFLSNQAVIDNSIEPWLKGCASLNKCHEVLRYKGLSQFVEKKEVQQITISRLLEENCVRGIKHLKIDAEGCDCYILWQLLDYLEGKDKEYYPEKITFESNFLTKRRDILITLGKFIQKNYLIKELQKNRKFFKLKGKNFSNKYPNDTVMYRNF